MLNIAIVILTWNGWEYTKECLKSINKLRKKSVSFKIIVVDNASTDATPSKIKKYFPKVTLIRNKLNLGFARGNNIGIKYALEKGCHFIFILNNDTVLHPLVIEEMLETWKHFDAAIVTPKIYFSPGREFHKMRYTPSELGHVIWYAGGVIDWNNVIGKHEGVDEVDRKQFDRRREVDFATGAAMFVKSGVFERIGFFDERYYLYYEDLDFSLRAKKAGIKIIFSPKAFLWHQNAAGSSSGSFLQDYYIVRNRLLFGMRYAPFKSKLSLLKESITLLIKGRRWQKRGVVDFYLKRFGRGSYISLKQENKRT